MPRRIRRGPRRVRRMFKRKGRRSTKLVNMKALSPFPQRYITTCKYSENITVPGPGGGGLAQYNYRLNSIFDPNLSGIGYQPYGHDTLATLYNRYRVISCSYVIHGVCTDNASNTNSQIVVIPANEAITLSGGFQESMSHPKAKFISQPNNGAALKPLKGTVYLPSLVGRSKAQYMADDRYQAVLGANPLENAILNIFGGMITSSATTVSMNISITLKYTVEYFDFKNLPLS